MQKVMPRPSLRSVIRVPLDRRRDRPRSGFVPTPKGSGLVPFESTLGAELIEGMAADPFVATIRAHPETFVWRDGANGRRRRYVPGLLAVMTDGSKVYRSVMSQALLMRDPELSGRRARIELECAVRGASFEIWTDREIREATSGWRLLRVATSAETTTVAGLLPCALGDGAAEPLPGLVLRLAERLSLSGPRRFGDLFFARSMLTGILMAFRCHPVRDPVTGVVVWKAAPRGS